ncbi:MAG: hypothetical protein Fur0025_19940 [Oscillatoriaceae cyanobacterium]|uniref:hypothetical protein n=1 Tax=[Phormidium] sp. ETS-05 TaxID=222819 RepID=UPI0018EF16BF|nr:hypothetical protein [[Phormidium] sp. ETS-05]
MTPINLLPGAIIEIMASVSSSGCLTLADRYGLLAAILEENITDEERHCLDRLFRALYRGRVAVVNEISTIL